MKVRIWFRQAGRLLTRKPLVHCWADGPDGWETESGISSTCMRAWGHLGRHEFVPDSTIGLTFETPGESS